jgi:hypothetical protein
MPNLKTKPQDVMYDVITDVLNNRAITRRVNPPAGSVYFFQGETLVFLSLFYQPFRCFVCRSSSI